MILYYALGGGLGHLARSLVLIEHAPEQVRSRIRILVSSNSAGRAESSFPCPVDRVPDPAMADAAAYDAFLNTYFEMHRFRCIVIDTFPFGLLGEMKYKVPHIPRVLIGRYLRWAMYRDACRGVDDAAWPEDAVVIEQQDDLYERELGNHCFVTSARWPISAVTVSNIPGTPAKPACCIVHSGPHTELALLVDRARKIMGDRNIPGDPQVFTPDSGIFPMERHLLGFSDIVTGAGYASCSASVVLAGRLQYHLTPFERRFDDQNLRLLRLKNGTWLDGGQTDASHTARMLWDIVGLHV
jgi:hypothetical protein